MSLLDQLWDDTLAGPRPESGLGKLRKHSTFSFRPNSGKESNGGNVRSDVDESPLEAAKVTRSIMIVKPPGYQNGSPPVSPAGSTPPVSPFSGINQRKARIYLSFSAQYSRVIERVFGFVEGQHRTHMRRQTGMDSGDLLLLTTCDI
ncbi:hypothetical protein Patl1_22362 [Pistacia atlantica]|uniref:Uncharacterized protein n=1 Tax=Pistacia atlantica TaxID=434234 RepID=A0ACC0ZWW3_9ROSI|nr:hypothetical protein Patl1_22362 [Pistacia atlantica]